MLSKREQLFEGERLRQSDIFEFLPYVRIQEPGELAVEYELWPHLEDFYKNLASEKLIDLIKSKQIGVSWALAIQALWEIYFVEGWSVLEFSRGQVESQALLAKSKIVYNNLPRWMRAYTLEPNSTERFGFKEMGSEITAFPSTETAGIGKTAGRVIHDESDFHEYYEVNLSHTRATVADSPERKLVSVSTVDKGKPDNYFKNHWRAANSGQNGFKALFYAYDVRPNRDQPFYDAMVRENEATPWVVGANYPRTVEEALSPQSAQSCFKKEVIDEMWANVTEPLETKRNYIHIFSPFRVGVDYSAGIDVGEGVGLDYSVLSIVGRYGLNSEVCAVIYTNKVGTDSFAYDCYELCGEYHNPLLCVDNIGVGRAVVDKLEELGYPKLFSTEVERKEKAGSKLTGAEKKGWALTRNNKRELVVKFVEVVNNGSFTTRYKPMVKELTEQQWVHGYPEPTGATHGDTIVANFFAVEMGKRVHKVVEASMYVGGQRIW